MKFCRLIALLLTAVTVWIVTACGESYEPQEPLKPDPAHSQLRILVVGNSYSWDAFLYAPWIIHNIDPNIDLTIGILCHGGARLKTHYDEHITQNKEYPYYHKTVNFGSWTSQPATTFNQAIVEEEWDLIVMQQASGKSFDYSTYTYIADIQEYINISLGRKPDYAWLLTPAYPDGSNRLPGTPGVTTVTGMNSSDEMYEAIANCAKNAMNDYNFQFLIPVGTAIQNARQIPQLDVLGNFIGAGARGHLSADGVHLQEGMPRLIANYTAAAAILNHYYKKNIDSDNITIDKAFCNTYAPGLATGQIKGMNEENRALAKQVVNNALANPYTITR